MKGLFIVAFLIVFHVRFNQTCKIEFRKLDKPNIVRYVYERSLFNITGRLLYCPSSITVRNISLANPSLKRLSIFNVTYVLEKKSIHITGLARLIGFAPITLQLYFQDDVQPRSNSWLTRNMSAKQRACARSSPDRREILRNCPKLKLERDHYVLTEELQVAINRRQTIIDALFTAVVTFLVTMGTLCIGCDLELEQIMQNIKRPIPLLIGLFCQTVYLPLLSLALAKIFQLDKATSLGLLSTGSCPGGSSSNIYTALLSGNVDLSVVMTFMSTTFSFATFPFWVWLLGSDYIDFRKTRFPWWNMFVSSITLFLPALTGLFLRRYRPVIAYRIGRFLNPIAVGYLVFILTFGTYINTYIFYIVDFKSILAGCFLPWFGFMGGAILSLIGVRDKKKNIAICIETGIQNTAVAIIFLRLTFPQPEADIALANPILVSMAIPIPFLVLFLTRSLLKKYSIFQKCLPSTNATKTIQNGHDIDTPEKLIAKELLNEQTEEKAGQIEKTVV